MSAIFVGIHPTQGRLFAAVDAYSRFVEPAVRSGRLGAKLAPYRSEADARHALIAAGADPDSIGPYRGAR